MLLIICMSFYNIFTKMIKIIKNILLNLPVILGLIVIDLITPRLLSNFVDKGLPLTTLQIIIVLIVSVLSIAFFIYWTKIKKLVDWSYKNVLHNAGKIAVAFSALFVFSIVFGVLAAKYHVVTSNNEKAVDFIAKLTPALLMWFVSSVAAPIMEEVIFRVGIFELFFPDRKKVALFVSPILFAYVHMSSDVTNWLAWLPYLFMGVVFSYLYYKTHKIEISITAHGLWNTFVTLLSLLPH